MHKNNLAFLDMEMTGLNALKHEIIEIGVVITTPELKIIEEFDIKVKPERIEDADPISLKVNNYDAKKWESAIPLKEAIEKLNTKVKDCIMVSHNIAFDALFLESALTKLNMTNSMHYHRLDTISIAWAKLHREPDLEHFSLRELCVRFGIENENAHTALSDARATYELYKKLMNL